MLSVPSRMKLWSIHDELAGHLRRYEKNAMIRAVLDRGFESVQVASYGFPFLNILRYLRILLTRLQNGEREEWTQLERTQHSGVLPSIPLVRWLGLICNPYTCYPLSLVASLFNRCDLSDGYVITADKGR